MTDTVDTVYFIRYTAINVSAYSVSDYDHEALFERMKEIGYPTIRQCDVGMSQLPSMH